MGITRYFFDKDVKTAFYESKQFLRKTTCFEKLYSYLFWTLSESSWKNFGTVVRTAIDMLSGTYWGFSVLKRWRIITIVRHSASKNLDSWRNFFGNCCRKCILRVQKTFSEQFFLKKKTNFRTNFWKGAKKFQFGEEKFRYALRNCIFRVWKDILEKMNSQKNHCFTNVFETGVKSFWQGGEICILGVQRIFWGIFFVWKKIFMAMSRLVAKQFRNFHKHFLYSCRKFSIDIQRKILWRNDCTKCSRLFLYKQRPKKTDFWWFFSGRTVRSALYDSRRRYSDFFFFLRKFKKLY